MKKYMLFMGKGEHRNIAIGTIRYFEVFNRVVVVHYNQNDKFEFFSTLSRVETLLSGHDFVRTHRSFLVSVAEIEGLSYEKIQLRDGTKLPVGRKYYNQIKEALSRFADITSKLD